MKKLILLAFVGPSILANHCSYNETVDNVYRVFAVNQIREKCPRTFAHYKPLKIVNVSFSSWDTEQYYTYEYQTTEYHIKVKVEGECWGGFSGPELGSFLKLEGCN
jgi:hypothetical protein